MESIQIESPQGGLRFETKLDWDTVQQEYGHYFNEEIVGYPEKFPCIGFNVHTQHNQDQRDFQIWAFVYPMV